MSQTATDSELDVLFPDRRLDIGGETLEVREFTFRQALELHPIAAPIIDALADNVQDADSSGLQAALDIIGAHAPAFAQLIGASCGRPSEWVLDLAEKDGTRLAMLFWAVNEDFFSRRLLHLIQRQAGSRSAGMTYSTP